MNAVIFKVFEHLTGFAFFELYESSTVSLADSHLQRMIEDLGDFPPNFLVDCRKRAKYFNDKGEQSKNVSPLYYRSLNYYFFQQNFV